jgi:hypothetical protein
MIMKQYQVYAMSPSLDLKLEHGAPFTDELLATQLASQIAQAHRASRHKGADDWEAWVRIEPQA